MPSRHVFILLLDCCLTCLPSLLQWIWITGGKKLKTNVFNWMVKCRKNCIRITWSLSGNVSWWQKYIVAPCLSNTWRPYGYNNFLFIELSMRLWLHTYCNKTISYWKLLSDARTEQSLLNFLFRPPISREWCTQAYFCFTPACETEVWEMTLQKRRRTSRF